MIPARTRSHRIRPSASDENGDDDDNDTKNAPVHRTYFPETWLWRLERMRSVGCKLCCDL